jgi:enamine deaminase RidA (YjgF/YER057c/UK114 family)
MNKVYVEYFSGIVPPARAAFAISGCAAGAIVEMDAIAAFD